MNCAQYARWMCDAGRPACGVDACIQSTVLSAQRWCSERQHMKCKTLCCHFRHDTQAKHVGLFIQRDPALVVSGLNQKDVSKMQGALLLVVGSTTLLMEIKGHKPETSGGFTKALRLILESFCQDAL